MRATDEPHRGRDECPRKDCEQSVIRVEVQIVDESRVLVYWHEITDRRKDYCIEYPNGEIEHFSRKGKKHGSKA